MKVSVNDITIRPLAETDSLEELTELLHRAYKKQADKGFIMLASHQDVAMTKRRLKGAECYVAIHNKKMVATVCYHRHNNSTDGQWYDRDDIATYGQFGVDPGYQNIGLGIKLMELMETRARKDKVVELTIDTAEANYELIAYYKKRGYREVGHVQWTLVNYRSVILSKKL